MTNKIKEINGRLILKHDTEDNWNKATSFIPKQGEIIIYDIDNKYSYERMKIGNGTTNIVELPFTYEIELITVADIDAICGTTYQDASSSEVKF